MRTRAVAPREELTRPFPRQCRADSRPSGESETSGQRFPVRTAGADRGAVAAALIQGAFPAVIRRLSGPGSLPLLKTTKDFRVLVHVDYISIYGYLPY